MSLDPSALHKNMNSTLKTELDAALGSAPEQGDTWRAKFCDAIAKAISEQLVKHIIDEIEIVGVKVEFPGGTYLMTSFGGFGVTPMPGGVMIPGTPIIPMIQPAPLFFGQAIPQLTNGKGLVK